MAGAANSAELPRRAGPRRGARVPWVHQPGVVQLSHRLSGGVRKT